jgi:hypothetical protein
MRVVGWRWAAALAVVAAAGAAAQEVDPDWPCVQRKVPELSIGQMWAGPIPEEGAPEEIRALAQELAPRRVEIGAVEEAAAAAVAELGPEARAERLGELFAAILDRINAERGEIIAGIGRYARRQAGLSDHVEELQLELAGLEAATGEARDEARIAELRERLAWETRVFRERSQSLAYVCETPVLLERRAFEIARALGELL